MKKLVIGFLGMALLFSACSDEGELAENVRETIYVRNKGADIPAHIYGKTASKTFLVIVHGGPGGSGIEYRGYYSQELEKDYAVVYTDQRGQGTSHGHYTTDDVNIETMTEDLYLLIKSLKTRYGADVSMFMLGHSWGGTLGTAYMLNETYQKELNGWLEVDGAHDIPMLNRAAIAMFKQIGQEQIDNGIKADEWQPIVDFANGVDTNNISNEEGGEINQKAYTAEGLIDEVQASSQPGGLSPLYVNHALISFIAGGITASQLENEVEMASYTDQMGAITLPTIFLWGKYDFVVSPRLAYTGYNQIGSTEKEIVIFEKSGHSPMDNEADLFIEKVKGFMEEWK